MVMESPSHFHLILILVAKKCAQIHLLDPFFVAAHVFLLNISVRLVDDLTMFLLAD
jgi:hypothetical protein